MPWLLDMSVLADGRWRVFSYKLEQRILVLYLRPTGSAADAYLSLLLTCTCTVSNQSVKNSLDMGMLQTAHTSSSTTWWPAGLEH